MKPRCAICEIQNAYITPERDQRVEVSSLDPLFLHVYCHSCYEANKVKIQAILNMQSLEAKKASLSHLKLISKWQTQIKKLQS